MNLGLLGAALAFTIASIGSGLGVGIVGCATVGVWKKAYLANKAASLLMVAFVGACLTNVFYGFILMGQITTAALDPANASKALYYLVLGAVAGVSLAIPAIVQGKIGAAAVDALCETGKGFSQYLTVIGIAETVALFTMVLAMISL